MNKTYLTLFTGAIVFVILFFFFSNTAFAGVIVYDGVTSAGRSVQLKAVTKGRFFHEGGKLVKFYLDETHIGTTLSGGDGYAFLEYLALSPGIRHLKVMAGVDTDKGILLVTGENDRVLLIEIEGALFAPSLRDFFKPAQGSEDTLYKLSKRFRIIYLTSLIGVTPSRKWLKDNDFPPSAVLKWEGDILDDLHEKGIRLYAIIASPAVLSEASVIKKRFSFKESEEGLLVKDWADLSKRLK